MSEASKNAGNESFKAGDFGAAVGHYTNALDRCIDKDDLLKATLLCNRSHARHRQGELRLAFDDSTEALEMLSAFVPNSERMRVKALYRRALVREALSDAKGAFEDLNCALKLAPGNSGLVEEAQRIRHVLIKSGDLVVSPPPHIRPSWQPAHLFNTKDIMEIADSKDFFGRCRGFTMLGSDPTVRFANGMGVTAHHGDGGLAAIWPLGPPTRLPRNQQLANGLIQQTPGVPEVGNQWFELPNMEPGDGFHVMYGRCGDLRWISFRREGELHGSRLRYHPDGTLKFDECAIFDRGQLVEKWQESLLNEAFVEQALVEVAIPVKKAMGVGLSLGERRLCAEMKINIDAVPLAKLNERLEGVQSNEVIDSESRLKGNGNLTTGWTPVGPADFDLIQDIRSPWRSFQHSVRNE